MMKTDTGCSLFYSLEGEAMQFQLEGELVRVGRSRECEFVLPESSVSRVHAEFLFEDGSWHVKDLDSKNGVSVNDSIVKGRTMLVNGDGVHIGSMALIFQSELSGPGFRLEDVVPGKTEMAGELSMDALQTGTISGGGFTLSQSIDDPLGDSVLMLFGEAARSLLASGDVDEMLQVVLSLAFSHLPAQRACIALCPHGDERIVVRLTRASDPQESDHLRISTTITSQAIRDRACVSYIQSEGDGPLSQSIAALRLTSILCAPLCVEDEVLGVIYLDTCDMGRPFDPHHLQVLLALASLSAVALREAKLRESVRSAERIRERLSRYSSPGVVERLIKDEEEGEGGICGMISDEAVITVIFADLGGFTTLAETMSPSAVTAVLNEIFEGLTEAVFAEEGTVDKFIGDEVMAFFGAPTAQTDHALRAVRCAISMQERLTRFNAARSDLDDLSLSIGINSGPVIVGDIGSPRRRDYTVIGDTVNTAKRIESQAAKGGRIVIGPLTHELIAGAHPTIALDAMKLRGKQHDLVLHVIDEPVLPR